MKETIIKKYQIFSVFFTFVIGAILHFTFNLSNQNSFIAFFSSINESVWEHLKLVFFPMLITTVIGYFYLKNDFSNFLCSKTIGILVSMAFIITFFYTYTGILGKNVATIDIASFFVATILGEYISYRLIISKFRCHTKLSVIILIILIICFFTFTYYTPNIGLFKDPITGQYGIIHKYL